MSEVTPTDSRYVPFTQQPSCCVPTSISMVMYKCGISLIPIEELGYHLGLVVPPEKAKYFYKVRTSDTPPPAGYGTQIYEDEYEPNHVFKKLGIPLSFDLKHIDGMETVDDLVRLLTDVEAEDDNALLCFNHGALVDDTDRDWGHVIVFDRIVDGQFRVVDPSPDYPKWRLIAPEKMFVAMKKHAERKTAAGVWLLYET